MNAIRKRKHIMADLAAIKPHMDIIGTDGTHLGTVDRVEGYRIELTRADSGSRADHHHYLSDGLMAAVEGNSVRLPFPMPAKFRRRR